MRYFCAVVEHGGVSRAARALHMAQPPLSQRLRELEQELGTRLFERQGRRLVLTHAGQVFHEHARQILNAVERTREDVLRARLDVQPPLRIGLSTTGRAQWLERFPAVQQRFASRRMGIVIADSAYLERMLRQGEIDLALMQPPQQNAGLTVTPLRASPLLGVVGGIDLPAEATVLTVEDLGRHPLLLVRRSIGMGLYELLLQQLAARGISADVPIYCTDSTLLLEMLRLGRPGIAVVPALEVREVPAGCRALPLDVDLPPFQLSLVHRAIGFDAATVRAMKEIWGAA